MFNNLRTRIYNYCYPSIPAHKLKLYGKMHSLPLAVHRSTYYVYLITKRLFESMRCATELIELKTEPRSAQDGFIQFGVPLQTIQHEQSLTTKGILPIGQTSTQRSHSLHFSLFIFNADFSSNLTHDTCLSISRQLEGQILMHLRHSIVINTLLTYLSLCRI